MSSMQVAQRMTADEYVALEQPEWPRTWLVDVRSPSTWRYDIGTKKSVYEREGLPELWLVDTDAGVLLVFRRSTPKAPSFDVGALFHPG